MKPEHYRLPELSLRFVAVWRRNFLVWRKLAIPSVLGNLADPLLYVIGLGFGLGMLVKEVQGVPYITCLLYTSPSPRDGLLSRMPSSA